MSLRLVLLAAACGLNPALKADLEAQPLGSEPRIVSGTFADAEADPAGQPVALWLEQGHALIASAGSLPSEAGPALLLPAQGPTARACLLLNVPETPVTSLRLRLKLAAAPEATETWPTAEDAETGAAPPETLEWELAGVPLRFVAGEAGRWQIDYHTAESGWTPLLAPEGEDLGSGSGGGWHTVALEFTSAEPRQWRLRWDEYEPGPWVAQTQAEPPLLVVSGGTRTAVWLDDLASTAESAAAEPPPAADPAEAAAALAARNAALRQEIAATLAELARETGVRRARLRRPASALLPAAVQRSASATRRLEVLTPLEDKQIHAEAP